MEYKNRLIEKKKRLDELKVTVDIYKYTELTKEKKAKEQDLKERLQFRLMALEEQGLDAKIDILQELIRVLKKK